MRRNQRQYFLHYLLVFLAFLTLDCSSENNDVEQFTLSVNNGSGSGQYTAGTSLIVSANTAPTGQEFDKWVGDIDQLNTANVASSRFIMPSKNAELTATYRAIELGPPILITIDKTTKYQTIDGFGFFGAYDVWWSGGSLWNDAWGDKMISDLGISIWRNEYYPPSTPDNGQTEWTKQKPVVEGLKSKADKYNVDLKFIFTVWSPPADLKWESNFTWPGDPNATRNAGTVTTKNGGTLNPNKYPEYADWLKAGIQLYKDVGVDLYALSLQNELMFVEPYNSCTYTFSWYNDLLIDVVPKIKATYPNVKIFGAENMLDLEGASANWPYFYHTNLKANATAAATVDILAIHGYSDGISPSSGSGLVERWTNHREQFSTPMNKPSWMTETSGYIEAWENSASKPGALSLALDIHTGLAYGNMSAWVWWQGSEGSGTASQISEYGLMKGESAGKKYAVSKQFYRYIRPGAVRIKAATDNTDIYVTAYEHAGKGTNTLLLINAGATSKLISLTGTDLPASFKMYRTNEGNENCVLIGEVNSGVGSTFELPAKTIVTLQAGGDEL